MARVERNPNFEREWELEVGPGWQRYVGETGLAAIRAVAPRDSGQMVAAMRWEAFTDDQGRPAVRYVFPAEHTIYVDQGTGLHGPFKRYITPRVAQAMRWMSPTGPVFAKRTRGQVGQRFIRRGLQAVFGRVVEHRHGRL